MSKRSQESEVPVAAKRSRQSDLRQGQPQHTMQIDEDLHSRQLAVYGRASMRRMAASDILICGARGLGVEIGWYIDNFQQAEHRLITHDMYNVVFAAANAEHHCLLYNSEGKGTVRLIFTT